MLQVVVATFPHFEPLGPDKSLCSAKLHAEEIKLACIWAKALEVRSLWQKGQATIDDVIEGLLKVSLWGYRDLWCQADFRQTSSSQKRHKVFWPWQQAHITSLS